MQPQIADFIRSGEIDVFSYAASHWAAEEGCCDRLRGDVFFGDAADHGKIEGTASSIKYRRPVKLLRKSVGLKYNEQILVLSVIWNVGDNEFY